MRIRFRYAAALFLPVGLLAQSTPEMGQVLDRLQRLEDQNRELTAEIRALRQQLAGVPATKAPAPVTAEATEATPAPASDSHLEEHVAINEQHIQDLDQAKVEAEHKLPVRLTGMLLFNAFANGRNSGGQEFPAVASLTPSGATDGGTLRQSVLGLKFDGPGIFAGGKVSGTLFMDFWGGSGTSLNQLVRVRVASLDFAWANTTFSVGQDKPILAPREPTSLAQVGVSPLTGAGNLWLWAPQARVEQRFHFGEATGLRAQLGVYQTSESANTVPAGYAQSSVRPALEGRFELWHQFGDDRRIEIAPGFHTSDSHVEGVSVPSRAFSIDWLIRPHRIFDFTGAFFQGENTAVLGGLRQGIFFGEYDHFRPVHSIGGWGQLTLRATSRLSFNVYGGMENDRNSDLLLRSIGKNQTYAGNIMYRLGSNVVASFEASQTRTTYVGIGVRSNPHYDLALAYLY